MYYINIELIPNNYRAMDTSYSNFNVYISMSKDTLKQNAVQFTQKDTKCNIK
jgi:hypothetical protein